MWTPEGPRLGRARGGKRGNGARRVELDALGHDDPRDVLALDPVGPELTQPVAHQLPCEGDAQLVRAALVDELQRPTVPVDPRQEHLVRESPGRATQRRA